MLNPGKTRNAVLLVAGSPRGDDVGCTTETITDVRTLYLTRTAGTLTHEAQSTVSAIRTRYPEAREVDVTGNRGLFMIPADQIPEHRTMGFDTRTSYEQATLGVANGWAVAYRFSAPRGRSGISGVLEGFWITTMLEPQLAARRAARAAAATGALPPPEQAPPAETPPTGH